MKKVFPFFICLLIVVNAFSQANVDSLLQLCTNASDKEKIRLYLEISFETRKDTLQSNKFSKNALQLAVKNKFIPDQAKATYYQAETRFYCNDFSGAIPYYEKAIPLYKQVNDTSLLTDCYNSIGLCFHKMDFGERAIAQFVLGLKLCDNNLQYSAKLLHNIGNVHKKMENYPAAINYFKRASNINLAIKDSVILAEDYNGLGEVYLSLNLKDSSLFYFKNALSLFKRTHQELYQAIVLANMASVYSNYPDSLLKAHEYFNSALAKFHELGFDLYSADIQEGIGEIRYKQGKFKEAIIAFNKSLQLTEKYNRGFSLKSTNYHELSKTYEQIGDYKSALKYHELYIQNRDSLDKQHRYEQITNLEKQYETEKKENEIDRLRARQELTNVQLEKNKQLKQLAFITASLLLILVFFIFYRYIDKTKRNRELQAKNKLIEESENELRILNAAKNKFFSIIAHDIKNPLHTIMGYSDLLTKDFELFTEAERYKFASDINHSTNSLYRLLQNLLEWSKAQTGSLRIVPLPFELKRIIENAVDVLRPMAENKRISIVTIFNLQHKIFADPLMIETVVRNLLNNAIKFTPENGKVEIEVTQDGNHAQICVRDTGIGLTEEDIPHLFKIDSKVKRKGTNEEDGSGLGLILCKEFTEKNNGTLWFESESGHGSSFFFTVPVSSAEKLVNSITALS